MPPKGYFGSEFVHLFFLQSRKSYRKIFLYTRPDNYGRSVNALVTKYHYANSFTIYTVPARSHLTQSSQELCAVDSILFTLQMKPRLWKIQSFAPPTSHSKQSGRLLHCSCQRTPNYCVFHSRSNGCCYMEIMQNCNFLSFAMSMNSVL